MTKLQLRTLRLLNAHVEAGGIWRHEVTRTLGRAHATLDEVIGLGWAAEKAIRHGRRGRMRRIVTLTLPGLTAYHEAITPGDEAA